MYNLHFRQCIFYSKWIHICLLKIRAIYYFCPSCTSLQSVPHPIKDQFDIIYLAFASHFLHFTSLNIVKPL